MRRFSTRITSPQAREFARKYADCMEAVRDAFLYEFDSCGYQGSLDQYICQLEDNLKNHVSQLESPNSIELAEKNAHQMPRVYVQYILDQRSGATRLKFGDYLTYAKNNQGGRRRVALA